MDNLLIPIDAFIRGRLQLSSSTEEMCKKIRDMIFGDLATFLNNLQYIHDGKLEFDVLDTEIEEDVTNETMRALVAITDKEKDEVYESYLFVKITPYAWYLVLTKPSFMYKIFFNNRFTKVMKDGVELSIFVDLSPNLLNPIEEVINAAVTSSKMMSVAVDRYPLSAAYSAAYFLRTYFGRELNPDPLEKSPIPGMEWLCLTEAISSTDINEMFTVFEGLVAFDIVLHNDMILRFTVLPGKIVIAPTCENDCLVPLIDLGKNKEWCLEE